MTTPATLRVQDHYGFPHVESSRTTDARPRVKWSNPPIAPQGAQPSQADHEKDHTAGHDAVPE